MFILHTVLQDIIRPIFIILFNSAVNKQTE